MTCVRGKRPSFRHLLIRDDTNGLFEPPTAAGVRRDGIEAPARYDRAQHRE